MLKFLKCLVIFERCGITSMNLLQFLRERKVNLKTDKSTHYSCKTFCTPLSSSIRAAGKSGKPQNHSAAVILIYCPSVFPFLPLVFFCELLGAYALLLLSPHLYIFLPLFPTFLCSQLSFFFFFFRVHDNFSTT